MFPFNLSDFVTVDEVGDVNDLPCSPSPDVTTETTGVPDVQGTQSSVLQEDTEVRTFLSNHKCKQSEVEVQCNNLSIRSPQKKH